MTLTVTDCVFQCRVTVSVSHSVTLVSRLYSSTVIATHDCELNCSGLNLELEVGVI